MPETFLVPTKPFKNKVYKSEDQGPGKRSLPGRPHQAQGYHFSTRPWQEELAGKAKEHIPQEMSRRIMRPGRTRRATSFRARQDCDPGKVLAGGSSRCVPALQLIWPRVALGPFQGHVADGCAAWGTRWQATVTRLPPWRTEKHGRTLLGRRRRAFNALVPHCQS